MILLDTNVCIALLNGRPQRVVDRATQVLTEEESFFVPSICLFELWFGVARSGRRDANSEALEDFLAGPIRIVSFETEDARIAGDLRQTLAATGRPIGPYDTLIAAQAIRLDALLVTANRSEFERVPGLRMVDWSEPDRERSTDPA